MQTENVDNPDELGYEGAQERSKSSGGYHTLETCHDISLFGLNTALGKSIS